MSFEAGCGKRVGVRIGGFTVRVGCKKRQGEEHGNHNFECKLNIRGPGWSVEKEG